MNDLQNAGPITHRVRRSFFVCLLAVCALIGGPGWSQEAGLHSRTIVPAARFIEVSGLEYDVVVVGQERADIEIAIYSEQADRIEIGTLRDSLRIAVATMTERSGAPRGSIELLIPHATAGTFQTVSGAVTITGVSGRVQAGSTSGSIAVREATGALAVRTASATVDIRQSDASVVVDAASGSVAVSSSSGEYRVSSGAGHQSYRSVNGRIRSRSSSGDVALQDVGGIVSIATVSGDITGEAVLLSGNASLESVSGDIRIDLANEPSELAFDSSTVRGLVRIGDQEGRELRVGTGAIAVRSRTTSGTQRIRMGEAGR